MLHKIYREKSEIIAIWLVLFTVGVTKKFTDTGFQEATS